MDTNKHSSLSTYASTASSVRSIEYRTNHTTAPSPTAKPATKRSTALTAITPCSLMFPFRYSRLALSTNSAKIIKTVPNVSSGRRPNESTSEMDTTVTSTFVNPTTAVARNGFEMPAKWKIFAEYSITVLIPVILS